MTKVECRLKIKDEKEFEEIREKLKNNMTKNQELTS